MARTTLDDYRGGRLPDPEPKPARLRCFAENCPMPGTITVDGSGWPTCAWHYGVIPSDIPKVTRALQDWRCVNFEINEARRALTGEIASDPKALEAAFATAWERLQPLAGDWAEQLRPTTIRTRNRFTRQVEDTLQPEGYGDWSKRLERFLGARVVEVLSVNRSRAVA